jgi:pimeloyl-ACP methyl ester carboxylesterase
MARAAKRAIWFPRAETVDDLGLVLNRYNHAEVGGPNFVMVHGLGVSHGYFEPLAEQLADAGTVWLVDLPGYGASPKPDRDVPLRDHARTLGATLDAAGIENPVLIGHSWGCQVVTQLADQRPELSDRLVLLSPTINPARRSAWKQFFDLLHDFWLEPPRADAFGLYSYFLTGRVRYYLAQVPHMIADEVEGRLDRIRTPALVVNGERDPIVPRDWAQQVATLLENGRLEIVPGAHVIMYTAAEQIGRLIEDFAGD